MAIKFVGTIDITDISMSELKIYLQCVKERIYKTVQQELKISIKQTTKLTLFDIYIIKSLYDEEGEECSIRALQKASEIECDCKKLSMILTAYIQMQDELTFQIGMKPQYLYCISMINKDRKNAIKGLEQYKAEAMDKIIELEEMCNSKSDKNRFHNIQLKKKKGEKIKSLSYLNQENNKN